MKGIGSPGMDDLRWIKPVRPGDALRLRSTAIEQRQSAKDSSRGSVKFRWEIINQNDEIACSMIGRQYCLRGTPAQ